MLKKKPFKKIAVLQSNYIPWKGYFDIINSVDCFIFHDDLQYTKNDWRNRNKIKTEKGPAWLTIPVGTSEKRLICEVEIKDSRWQKEHWRKICQNYSRAPYFRKYSDFFEYIYTKQQWSTLSELNQTLIKGISKDLLGITTVFDDSRKFCLEETKAKRMIELLKKVECSTYLSGPAAQSYINEKEFKNFGITVQWMNYSGYSEYNQFYPPFSHDVTILDLLFHTGINFRKYMLSF